MTARTVAAVDLGAESGRVTTVAFDGKRLELRIVNRFGNSPRVSKGMLRWDVGALWRNIRAGLAELSAGDRPIASVGVDTWGVDYGLFDAAGNLVDEPACYRDKRGAVALARALRTVGMERLYTATGVQIMSINAIFGLMSDAADHPERLASAKTLQMMPDVFHRMLCATGVSEYTAVSTSGAYDMARNRWATELLDDLGVPTHLLPEVVAPGTDVGALLPELAEGALAGARVILPAGHDTASAVVAVPYVDEGALFLSSGTWSLAGVEVPTAVVTAGSRLANLTNEGGYGGRIRLLRNVMGLWILQECRRQWASEGIAVSYPELAEMASGAELLVSIVNPDAADFLPPGDMPARIRDYCVRTGQPAPQSIAEVTRCVVDSLALGYRAVVCDIAVVTGSVAPSISVVGGGAANVLLAQLTADATGLPTYCGPVEATALGNGAVQLAALGELDGQQQIRDVIGQSTEISCYTPRVDGRWDAAAERFLALRAADLDRREEPVMRG
ncbi:MAG: rhamnulokinase [Actinomycetota bacterium]|nr:rhamnulokinase [Actinomycetota bacterium]